jgi:hypothetical protein
MCVFAPIPMIGVNGGFVPSLEEPAMFNMLKVCREVFGPWVTAAPSKRRSIQKRKPHRTLLRLEELERRLVPAPSVTNWTDAKGDHLASTVGNWDNGLPNATTQAILDGNKTKDGITFDIANLTCDGILVRNVYIGAITIQAGTSSNATVEIQSNSTPTLITRTGSGNNPLNLTNDAALQVDSGAGLYLDDITPACNLLNTNLKRKRGPPSLTLRVGEDLSRRRNNNSNNASTFVTK